MNHWATELVNGIASWIEYQRTLTYTRIPEGALQLIAEKILSMNLGTSGKLRKVESNYPICSDSKRKFADIVFWCNDDKKPTAVIELKVITSAAGKKPQERKDEIMRDILKLVWISKNINLKCFFLLVGEFDYIGNIVNNKRAKHSIHKILKYVGNIEERIDGRKAENRNKINEEYYKNIKKLGLTFSDMDYIYTRLRRKSVVGLRVNESKQKQKYRTSAFLWQVSHSKQDLKMLQI